MYATDKLKERRERKSGEPSSPGGARALKLTPEELQGLSGSYQPGQEAACEVHGMIDQGGTFKVTQVLPLQGAGQPPQGAGPAPMPGGPMMGG